MLTIKKKSKKSEEVPSAKTGPIGGSIGSAKTGPLGGDFGSANIPKPGEFKGVEMNALAKLRAAKKGASVEEAQMPKKKVVGEVSLGETEVKPDREGYYSRLKKRAK